MVGNGPMNKRLNFGGDPDHGFGSRMGTLVRRALAEVCTVPVLLVWNASFESDNLGKGGVTF